MAKTAAKAGGDAGTPDAKVNFRASLHVLLQNSLARPSAATLTNAINVILQSRGLPKISRALVEKWRSPKSPLMPSKPAIALALADALHELGVFRGQTAGSRSELLATLGVRDAASVEQMLDNCFEWVQRSVMTPPNEAAGLRKRFNCEDESEQWLFLRVVACLASQFAYQQQLNARLRGAKGDHPRPFQVLRSVVFDARPGYSNFELVQELSYDFARFVPTLLRDGVKEVRTLFVVRESGDAPRNSANDFGPSDATVSELKELAKTVQAAIARDGGGAVAAQAPMMCRRIPTTPGDWTMPDNMWTHLFTEDGHHESWELNLDGQLYARTRNVVSSTTVSAFLRPNDLLRELRLDWRAIGKRWNVRDYVCLMPGSEESSTPC